MGSSVLDKIIYEFYDSGYIDNESYLEVLEGLINTFYLYQSNLDNILTDEQIISIMSKYFNNECAGQIELLESYALDDLKNKIQEGKFYE